MITEAEALRAALAELATERARADHQTGIADAARESVRRERARRKVAEQEARDAEARAETEAERRTSAAYRAETYKREAELQQARADRLARILAVERGDASAAPSGWELRAGAWYRGAVSMVTRDHIGQWSWVDEKWKAGVCTNAFEAMEAADAAREGR